MPGPQGGFVFDIFATSQKTLYARSSIGVYRLTADAAVWTPVNVDISIEQFRMPMAEHAGILYVVSTDEVLASTDEGETWNALGLRPEGNPAALIVIDGVDGRNARANATMYLALWDNGIFRSTDAGKTLDPRKQWVDRQKDLQTCCNWRHGFCWYRQRSLPAQLRYLGAIADRYVPDYPRLSGL